jgi:hypothetical protein
MLLCTVDRPGRFSDANYGIEQRRAYSVTRFALMYATCTVSFEVDAHETQKHGRYSLHVPLEQ